MLVTARIEATSAICIWWVRPIPKTEWRQEMTPFPTTMRVEVRAVWMEARVKTESQQADDNQRKDRLALAACEAWHREAPRNPRREPR